MNIDDVFGPSPYLKASDLSGRTVVAVVNFIDLAEIGFPKRQKLIAHFVGKSKTLPLNKTNAEMFAALAHSRNTDDWRGLRVRLQPVKFQNRDVDTVRVIAAAAEHQAADRTGQSEKTPATTTGQNQPETFVRTDGKTDRRERERPDDGNRPRPGVVYNGKR
jgi:hypothetical protein